MATLPPVRAAWTCSIAICIAIASAASPRVAMAQHIVRVQAETRMQAVRDPSAIRVTLRDDAGSAIGRARLSAEIDGRAHLATTDEQGVCTFPIGTLGETVHIRFEGDRFHRASEVALDALDRRVAGTIVVSGIANGRISLGMPTAHVTLRFDGVPPGDRAVSLRDEVGTLLAQASLSGGLPRTLTLRTGDLGPPGAGRLTVHFDGDDAVSVATTEVPYLRTMPLELRVEAVAVEGDPMTVAGRIAPALPGFAVSVRAGDRLVGTSLSADDGSWQVRFAAPVEAHEVLVAVDPSAPWWLVPPPTRVRVDRARPATQWVAWLTAIAGLLFGVGWVLKLRTGESTDATAPAPVQLGRATAARSSHRDIIGDAADARTGAPIQVSWTAGTRSGVSDATGRFAFDLDHTTTVQFAADGFVSVECRFPIPHRGEGHGVRIRLDSLRARATRLMLEAFAPWAPPEGWRGLTDREILRHARGRAGNDTRLGALVDAVERVVYAPDPPTHAQVAEIAELARVDSPRSPSL